MQIFVPKSVYEYVEKHDGHVCGHVHGYAHRHERRNVSTARRKTVGRVHQDEYTAGQTVEVVVRQVKVGDCFELGKGRGRDGPAEECLSFPLVVALRTDACLGTCLYACLPTRRCPASSGAVCCRHMSTHMFIHMPVHSGQPGHG